MQRILEALAGALQGGPLTAHTPFWPAPLIDRLRSEGYAVEGRIEPDGSAWIAIHVPPAA